MPSDEELLIELESVLTPDGALRDIVIAPAKLPDCERGIEWVRYAFKTSFTIDGELVPWPGSYALCVERRVQNSPRLTADVEGFSVRCHFFSDEFLEFDIEPREVASAVHRQGLLDFMRNLSNATSADVVLTIENWQACTPSLYYSAQRREFVVVR